MLSSGVSRLRALNGGQFARDVSGTVGVSAVVVLAGGLQSVMIARRFGPAGKGLISLVLLVPGTLTPLLAAGFAASCVYFASRAPAAQAMRNATTYAFLASAVGIGVGVVLVVSGALGEIAPDLSRRYLAVGLGMLPLVLAQSLFGGLLMGVGHIARVNSIRACQAIMSVSVVGLAVAFRRGPFLIACGLLLTAAVATVLQVIALRALGAPLRWGWSMPLAKDQVIFAAKDHPGTVVQFMNYRLDQFFVSHYRGATGIGLYSVAVTLGELLWLVPDAIATVVFPRASRERMGEGRRATAVAAGASLALAALGALGLVLVGRTVIIGLFSDEFRASYSALLWLLPGAVALGPAKILTADLAGRGYPAINSICSVVGLVATIGFDVALIPSHGIAGAAMASSISYVAVGGLALVAFCVFDGHADAADALPN